MHKIFLSFLKCQHLKVYTDLFGYIISLACYFVPKDILEAIPFKLSSLKGIKFTKKCVLQIIVFIFARSECTSQCLCPSPSLVTLLGVLKTLSFHNI